MGLAVLTLTILVLGGPLAADLAPSHPIRVEVSTAFTTSAEQMHVTATTGVTYQTGRVGFGAGVRGYLGLGHDGIYIAPHARVEFHDIVGFDLPGAPAADNQDRARGLLYLAAGPLFIAHPPELPANAAGGVMLLVGTYAPIARVGRGSLGLDLGLELSPPPRAARSDSTGDAVVDLIVGAWNALAGSARHRWKVSLGLTLAYPL